MNFSQRIGKSKIRTIIQKDSIDKELKVKLWNIFYDDFLNFYEKYETGYLDFCFKDLWTNFFGNRSNEYSISLEKNLSFFEFWFFDKAEWNHVYDFTEKICEYICHWQNRYPAAEFPNFIKKSNIALEKHLSAYRIIKYRVVPVTDDIEIKSIEEAFEIDNTFKEASIHLNTSISYFSHRDSPSYRNSIKESISAVENVCKIITGENTLGKALNKLEKAGVKINPSLKSAFDKLYTYTNDSKTGIRHALIDAEYTPDFDEAKFMLVTCSAFINYLKAKVV